MNSLFCIIFLVFTALVNAGCNQPLAAPTANKIAPTLQEPALQAHLPIPLSTHDGRLYVRTYVNDSDAGQFMIDTGSSLTVIGQGIAARLGLPVTRSGSVVGIGGQEQFTFRRVNHLSIGGLRLQEREMAALNMTRFQKPVGVAVNGVIGFGTLRPYAFTIDGPGARLTVYPPQPYQPPESGHAQQLLIVGGLPTVFARLGGRHRVRVLLDTGADNELTLPHRYVERWPDIVTVPVTGRGRSFGVGGSVESVRTWVTSLDILGVKLKRVRTSFTRSRPNTNALGIGRIGNKLLKHFRLTLHPAQRRVWAEWQPEDG